MIPDKRLSLQPLLESSEGVHLTGYLSNHSNQSDLKRQLGEVIHTAHEFLNPVMSQDERTKFLEPLEVLRDDARILDEMEGNIGLFRTKEFFRIVDIPVDVESACVVATSFHVKPLLRWMQADEDFLLLGIECDGAHLYLGSRSSFVRIESVIFPEAVKSIDFSADYESLRKKRNYTLKLRGTFAVVNEWLSGLTRDTKPRLFVAGERSLTDLFYLGLSYANIDRTAVSAGFSDTVCVDAAQVIRSRLKVEASQKLENALTEFRLAEGMNLAKKNIFEIAKAAVQGRVRKLIVAEEIKIFGRIDFNSGGLAIHPFALDHEDDDILDDLAQVVLAQGGEVIVTSKDNIPKGHPILAIFNQNEAYQRSAV